MHSKARIVKGLEFRVSASIISKLVAGNALLQASCTRVASPSKHSQQAVNACCKHQGHFLMWWTKLPLHYFYQFVPSSRKVFKVKRTDTWRLAEQTAQMNLYWSESWELVLTKLSSVLSLRSKVYWAFDSGAWILPIEHLTPVHGYFHILRGQLEIPAIQKMRAKLCAGDAGFVT